MLPPLLPIQPFTRPVSGNIRVPGSKSVTNRALLLAALCDQPVTLTGALFSEDTLLMAEALRQLGFSVESDPAAGTARVSGQDQGFTPGRAELHVGLAGTAARFLTALCAAAPRGTYRIDGVPQMRRRPMRGLIEALRQLGADIRCLGEEGFLPVEIRAQGLAGGACTVDASESSQILSALLMVAPLARGPVEIAVANNSVRWPFVQMTLNMMRLFGHERVKARQNPLVLTVQPQSRYVRSGGTYPVETDATAASYFIVLPIVAGGRVTVRDYRLDLPLQGDVLFALRLGSSGLIAALDPTAASPTFSPGPSRDGISADFRNFADTFLTLAAIAPLLRGPTRIAGIGHTRQQETDRVAGMARELRKLGQEVIEERDALTITPRPLQPGVTIETYGDHRFAMSFAILGCHDLHGDGRPWLTIRDPACCAKTFPGFFDLLDSLRAKSLQA